MRHSLLPLHSAFLPLLFLLLLPLQTTAERKIIHATSPAAVAYAAMTGCNIVSYPNKCNPDVCFAAFGRCMVRPDMRQYCYPQVLHNGREVSRQWTSLDAPVECRGCKCAKLVEEAKAKAKARLKWVWGEGGGVLEVGAGGERGNKEKCLIQSGATCDAEACFEGGGRCRAVLEGRRECRPWVLKGRTGWVREGWTRGNAGGKCRGCVCRGSSRIVMREKGKMEAEAGAGDAYAGRDGDDEFHEFLSQAFPNALDPVG